MEELEGIVVAWLKENGYDGLYCQDSSWKQGPCACSVDDLLPCMTRCQPAYKVPCDATCEKGKCDFHLALERVEIQ